jgi:hypothetical protein
MTTETAWLIYCGEYEPLIVCDTEDRAISVKTELEDWIKAFKDGLPNRVMIGANGSVFDNSAAYMEAIHAAELPYGIMGIDLNAALAIMTVSRIREQGETDDN